MKDRRSADQILGAAIGGQFAAKRLLRLAKDLFQTVFAKMVQRIRRKRRRDFCKIVGRNANAVELFIFPIARALVQEKREFAAERRTALFRLQIG